MRRGLKKAFWNSLKCDPSRTITKVMNDWSRSRVVGKTSFTMFVITILERSRDDR
jgi:hypothetical protein